MLTEKMHRTIVAITGALITYFTLTFVEGFDFSKIVDLLIGSQADGFVNLHSLILIISMMFIVQVADEAGVFQFLAVIAIKYSRGKPIPLMIIFCLCAVLFSALINNILTVMILIPLTVTVSRILNIDPTPYILTQAVLVNVGGTLFSISSIPNILITTSAGISFAEYLFNLGFFSLVTAGFSIIFFIFLYKPELVVPRNDLIKTLAQFDIWNVVQSRRMVYASIAAFIILIISFIVVPPSIIPQDILALSIAMLLIIISGFDAKEIMKKFDYELLLYLLGIFVIAGGLEVTGVIEQLGGIMQSIGGSDPLIMIVLILWVAAILSSLIDNIPITKVLIPVISSLEITTLPSSTIYYGLSLGANWGDNLTPLGDNILVMNLAAQHKRPITMKTFWKLGISTTIVQLMLATLYFTLFFQFMTGIAIVFVITLIILFLIITKRAPTTVQLKMTNVMSKLDKGVNKLRKAIIT
ncbi:MAG: SLC13 family permease [Candidatus Hodarchaeales archaeon]